MPSRKLWPELEWIADADLREKVTDDLGEGVRAVARSRPRTCEEIPFTLLVPNCPVTFMEHKRCVVHIARRAAEAMQEFMGHALPIDMDTVIAGAILADVGKLLEYEKVDGKARAERARRAACGTRSPAWRWPWSAACPTRSATSSRPTPTRATWSSAPPRRTSSTTPTS